MKIFIFRIYVLHFNQITAHTAYLPYCQGFRKNSFVHRGIHMIHTAREALCLGSGGAAEPSNVHQAPSSLGPAQMSFDLLFHEPDRH